MKNKTYYFQIKSTDGVDNINDYNMWLDNIVQTIDKIHELFGTNIDINIETTNILSYKSYLYIKIRCDKIQLLLIESFLFDKQYLLFTKLNKKLYNERRLLCA